MNTNGYNDITNALKENMERSKKQIQKTISDEMAKRGLSQSTRYSDELAQKLTDLMAKYNIDVAQIGLQAKRMQEAKNERERELARQKRDHLINTLLNTAINVGYIAGGNPIGGITGIVKNIFGKKKTDNNLQLKMGTIGNTQNGLKPMQLKIGNLTQQQIDELIKTGWTMEDILKYAG